jgi:integrase
VIRDHDDGVVAPGRSVTVADAVRDWLAYGLGGASVSTVENYTILAQTHVVTGLGARKLRDLRAADVDRWLATCAATLSTRTLHLLHSILSRALNRAMARDLVKRNVAALCSVPAGLEGRPSKSLTLDQAKVLLDAAEASPMRAYVVLSLLTGARTEELRALTWKRVDLIGRPEGDPPTPATMEVWHSVRAGGDTKTKSSRRTLALPQRCVDALKDKWARQEERGPVGTPRQDLLVFASEARTGLDAHNVRRAFRRVVKAAGLEPGEWTPRELRHSFVSLLSDGGMSVEDIADLCGHAGTAVTESVYRQQLRPVLLNGAIAMDRILPGRRPDADG